jgi:RepB DNA-primase from phage plasmid/Primase C terminal 1 (PriCT-1)
VTTDDGDKVADEAQVFLRLMAGDWMVTFQTFDDTAQKRRRLSHILNGSLAQHVHTLANLNASGAGVFWMVNAGDGGRAAKNVRAVRAVFIDLDGAPLEPVKLAPLRPHCIIETSPGRWHAYWRVSDCSLLEFRGLQKELVARFGSDPKVCDLSRVMRLPGFDHCKRERFRVRIIDIHDSAPYSVANLRRGLLLSAPPVAQQTNFTTLPERIVEGERNSTLFDLSCGLIRKGFDETATRQRIRQYNLTRCNPALSTAEIERIVEQAVQYGSNGFTVLSHRLLDSPEWKALSFGAQAIIGMAFRRYNGFNNGNVALTPADFAGHRGFANKDTFYRCRTEAMNSEIIVRVSQGVWTQSGRTPDLFAIADKWLHKTSHVSKNEPCASSEKAYSYIDKQSLGK